ncbi:conserved hypothetical protein [Leishmania major strain Friedlin]|uniref:DUF4110 domain-containing protein n=1 Tax=Leishmania major TaxID=5664 RepID=Q4QF12_LEIMA|nr:conserved hypothetical protein [Leishmania major strain Friedlin]CAG9572042.1 Galactose_oxidase_-_central_domain/Kelch_motif/Domain_of_unknown_function_(DUF4110)_-_putative [Leishmania major strain Friedlin]CAJ03405.1 conserved hypothetical protein [Leishmania major strain Friedlin]|eukprot:XP_001682086.1 conserved hypothetical protein [Leishmania major strain Friedlin]
MGKGRDKRKKNEDPAKATKRAARQALKLQKSMRKENGEEAAEGFNNEEAIEVTLKRIQKQEGKVKTVEEVANVAPPTPRVNVVLVPHPERDSELILFGGEFWNGETTEAYNDTYFFNVKRNAWARLSSALNPAPRSSSQAVVYKQYLILFGGEFVSQSQSQYLHFKDVWRFNCRSSEWEELRNLKGGPSSRSGHRMVLWKRNAVMFGGFYDNAQECRYFDDLWLLSNLDGAGHWSPVKTAPMTDLPHARSGHSMSVYQDELFVYGGYSTQKFNRFKKSEATVHHDLWMITLRQEKALACSEGPLPVWTKIKLGGIPPPIRCGVSCAFKDKRLYLFGGVVDIESPGGKMVSTFYNDLYVFHMDTKRFYPVVLRRVAKRAVAAGKRDHLDDLAAQLSALDLRRGEASSEEESSSTSDEEDDDRTGQPGTAAASQEMKESYETNRHGQILPHRRMDSAMVVVGNTLYLYGGQFESSKKEITMSDLFTLNLNKLDTYQPLLSQDLSAAVWLGKESESDAASWESGSTVVSAVYDLDHDEDDDDGDDEEDGADGMGRRGVNFGNMPREPVLDPEDEGNEAPEAIPAELAMEVTPSVAGVADAVAGITRTGKKGLKVHKEQLLAQLGASSAVPTPEREETFTAFFARTSSFWMSTARESVEGRCTDRRVTKEATEFAKQRFYEARELLAQLQLVEDREREEVKFFRERRLRKEREWEEYEEAQRRLEENSDHEEDDAHDEDD